MKYRPRVRRTYCADCKASVNFVLDESDRFYICLGDRRTGNPGCDKKLWITDALHQPPDRTDL